MPELGTSGSVRGVSRNGHPYRDPRSIPDLRHVVAMATAASHRVTDAKNLLCFAERP
jgi:hypothetical protein